MKKMIIIVLCLLLTLSLVGCGKNDDEGVIEYVEIPLDGGAVGTVEAFARLEEGKMIVCLINHEWYEFVAK